MGLISWIKSKFKKGGKKAKAIGKNPGLITEWSYQRFCKFYGNIVLPDSEFETKINGILECVNEKKLRNIDEIARQNGCTYDECILKIKYLKNKKKIGPCFIDYLNRCLSELTLKDQEILSKYVDYIYKNHYSVAEISQKLPNYHNKPLLIIQEDVYKDIKYLYERSIINGIKLNEENNEIIYYSIEKHNKSINYKTVNCSNCGVVVDVARGGNGRCEYCGSINTDSEQLEDNKND